MRVERLRMRLALVLAVVLALVGGGGATASTPAGIVPGTVTVSGVGGQQVVLDVPEHILDLDYRLDDEPRLEGPDGTVGGVIIQRTSNLSLRGALLLTNVPGFQEAVGADLIGQGTAHLPRGRYVVTLLGDGPQTLTFDTKDRAGSTALVASGPARSITWSRFGSAPVVDQFSEDFTISAPVTILAMSMGSGGGFQQSSARQWCLSRAASRADVCTVPFHSSQASTIGSTTGASWETYPLYGSLTRGSFVFSGRSTTVGGVTASHAVVLIAVPSRQRQRHS